LKILINVLIKHSIYFEVYLKKKDIKKKITVNSSSLFLARREIYHSIKMLYHVSRNRYRVTHFCAIPLPRIRIELVINCTARAD